MPSPLDPLDRLRGTSFSNTANLATGKRCPYLVDRVEALDSALPAHLMGLLAIFCTCHACFMHVFTTACATLYHHLNVTL